MAVPGRVGPPQVCRDTVIMRPGRCFGILSFWIAGLHEEQERSSVAIHMCRAGMRSNQSEERSSENESISAERNSEAEPSGAVSDSELADMLSRHCPR